MDNDVNQLGTWNIGQPGGMNGPFYSVLKPSGIIVALRVPDEKTAGLIAYIPLMIGRLERISSYVGLGDYENVRHETIDVLGVLRPLAGGDFDGHG